MVIKRTVDLEVRDIIASACDCDKSCGGDPSECWCLVEAEKIIQLVNMRNDEYVINGGFDRVAYQREYMRKRRAKQKEQRE